MVVHDKVVAYITHRGRLLVFRHVDFPEAGIQVPAGTLRPGEDPAAAALREAHEETGLRGLALTAYLGDDTLDAAPYGKPGVFHRRFYQLAASGEDGFALPERWRHWEGDPSGHLGMVYLFELWWCDLPHCVPALAGQQGALLHRLVIDDAVKGAPQ